MCLWWRLFRRNIKIYAGSTVNVKYTLKYDRRGIHPIQWRHNERDGVSNYRRPHCLLSCWFRWRSKKTSKLCATGFLRGIHLWPVNYPYKRLVTQKMFPFDDVIMNNYNLTIAENNKPHNNYAHIFLEIFHSYALFNCICIICWNILCSHTLLSFRLMSWQEFFNQWFQTSDLLVSWIFILLELCSTNSEEWHYSSITVTS